MTPITHILKISEYQYRTMLFDTYVQWCSDWCSDKRELQSLIANGSLSAYFLSEYGKLDAEFIELISGYTDTPGVSVEDLRTLYSDSTLKIFNRFSKSLIEKAKKTNISNYDNGAARKKSQGS